MYNTRVTSKTSIQQYTGGPVACNAWLIAGESGYILVDAPQGVLRWLQRTLPQGAKVTDLLLTHQHYDHVQGAAEVQQHYGCRIHAHSAFDRHLTLESLFAGLPTIDEFRVDNILGNGQGEENWGGITWQCYHIPGHAPDGMAYYAEELKSVFVGDILFEGSIGRTDFPGGSFAALIHGIREHLLVMDPHTEVCSGHGPSTYIGEEMIHNPYLT